MAPDGRSLGMSALGHKRSLDPGQLNVRFAPKAVIQGAITPNEYGGTMMAVVCAMPTCR